MDRRRRVQTDDGGQRLPSVPMSRRELVALAPVLASALSGCAGLWGGPEPGSDGPTAGGATTTYGYGGTPTSAGSDGAAGAPTTAPAGSSGGGDPTPSSTGATTTGTPTTTTITTAASTAEADYGEQGYGQYGYGGTA